MSEPIIVLKDVVKVYRRGREEIRALDGINLAVKRGEFLAIVGPSGSGKTTLLNIIGCLDRPTQGKVIIEDQDSTLLKEKDLVKIRQKKFGFIFQQFFLIPTLTAYENVLIPGLFAKNRERNKRAKELLSLVGLDKRLNHFPTQLSGGEMQRVAIARSLINTPSIVLADEPTGNLDSKTATEIFNLLLELNQEGYTIIVVTHNRQLAKLAHTTIFLKDGKIYLGGDYE